MRYDAFYSSIESNVSVTFFCIFWHLSHPCALFTSHLHSHSFRAMSTKPRHRFTFGTDTSLSTWESPQLSSKVGQNCWGYYGPCKSYFEQYGLDCVFCRTPADRDIATPSLRSSSRRDYQMEHHCSTGFSFCNTPRKSINDWDFSCNATGIQNHENFGICCYDISPRLTGCCK